MSMSAGARLLLPRQHNPHNYLRVLLARGATRSLSSTVDAGNPSVLQPVESHRQVLNQSPPFEDVNFFQGDTALAQCVERYAPWAVESSRTAGALAGSAHVARLAESANNNPPKLRTHDRNGRRIDCVEFHPAYHELMNLNVDLGITTIPWHHHQAADKPFSHVARSALGYMLYQAESGTSCPITMTFASVPALNFSTDAQKNTFDWKAKVLAQKYDPRDIPATEKDGVTIGMSMTERQGGSDVRANTTFATPCDAARTGPGSGYFLRGHKWFTSAPMCDAFLTLAQTTSGLSCFLVPRWIPATGERNRGLVFLRLKEKLGDRSNASSEVEYHDAYGELLGEEGRGVATILQMVHHTRLDCTVGSAGLMRRCVAEALHHTANRKAFGSTLNSTPIMQGVLADLALESIAATHLAMRVASTFSNNNEHDTLLARLGTAVAKYHICKRLPGVSYESMECLGGNGYVDDSSPMPRLYRQAPLNAIWEGSGNVICLDVLRAMKKDPTTVDAFFAELHRAEGLDERLDGFVNRLSQVLAELPNNVGLTRLAVGMMATAWQAALLLQHSEPEVADGFCASRLTGSAGTQFGCLPIGVDSEAIVRAASPAVE